MSIAAPNPRSAKQVEESLRSLRSKITTWFAVDGLCRLLVCFLVIVAIDIFIDWRFNLDRAQRIAMLLFAIVPLAFVAYRYLFRPWLGRLSDDALCLEVERRNKQLVESLISAMQFARVQADTSQGPEVKHVSSAMVDATIQEGIANVKNVAFEDILDLGRFRTNSVVLGLCSLLLVGGMVATAVSAPMRTWFQRNVLLQEKEWADHTQFVFAGLDETGTLAIPHGSNWPLIIEMVDQEIPLPSTVDVDLRGQNGSRVERAERFEQNREFRVTLKRVTAPLEIRARSGRSRTEWVPVRLVTRPATEKLQLQITPPKYSKLPKQVLPEGEGPYYVLQGSQLTVEGESNKPLAKATLIVGSTPHEMNLDGDEKFKLELSADQVTATRYRIELEDREHVWSHASKAFVPLRSQDGLEFTLKNSPDVAPSVRAELIGIGSMVLPGARIPYKCTIDDDFGITASRLAFEWRLDSPDAETESG